MNKSCLIVSIISSIILAMIFYLDNLLFLFKHNIDGTAGIIGYSIGFLFLTFVVSCIIYFVLILILKIINRRKK